MMWREEFGRGKFGLGRSSARRPGNFRLSNGRSWSSASSRVDPRCNPTSVAVRRKNRVSAACFADGAVACLKGCRWEDPSSVLVDYNWVVPVGKAAGKQTWNSNGSNGVQVGWRREESTSQQDVGMEWARSSSTRLWNAGKCTVRDKGGDGRRKAA